jgi:hypothetical protein
MERPNGRCLRSGWILWQVLHEIGRWARPGFGPATVYSVCAVGPRCCRVHDAAEWRGKVQAWWSLGTRSGCLEDGLTESFSASLKVELGNRCLQFPGRKGHLDRRPERSSC